MQESLRKQKLKKFFGVWNAFELALLFGSISVVSFTFFLGSKKDVWSYCSSLSGIVCVLFTAKGNPVAQYISILFAALYSVVAYCSAYYGEMLIYTFLMIPIHVFCILSWLKNRKNPQAAEVKVNTLSKQEYLIMGACDIAMTVCFYFLLKALGTSELTVSTISLVTSVSAAYLMLRRSEYYAVCFIANDIVLLVLWGLELQRNISCLPTLITFTVFLVNDIYGFLSWKKRKKQQRCE
ncbi:MAG: nicotinamide mononucleotide transporter [Clostridia bacterium]|nr:nicotinamide mononucleotide transporter [Clostridia bacterium]